MVERITLAAGSIAFRVLTPRWAHRPLSGAGAARNGGRFHPPEIETLYLSEDPMTAIEEYRQDMPVITPVTLAAYVIGPLDTVDIMARNGEGDLPEPWSDWRCAWKLIARVQKRTPPSWLCGDEARRTGAQAIRFPSTRRDGGVNVAVYTDLAPDRSLAVYDPENALPRDQSSWG